VALLADESFLSADVFTAARWNDETFTFTFTFAAAAAPVSTFGLLGTGLAAIGSRGLVELLPEELSRFEKAK